MAGFSWYGDSTKDTKSDYFSNITNSWKELTYEKEEFDFTAYPNDTTPNLSGTIYKEHNELVNKYIQQAYDFSYDAIYQCIPSAAAQSFTSAGVIGADITQMFQPDSSVADTIIDLVLEMTGVKEILVTINTLITTFVENILNPIFTLLEKLFSTGSICSTNKSIDAYRSVIYKYMRDMEIYHYYHTSKETGTPIETPHEIAPTAKEMQTIETNANEKTDKIIDEVNGLQFGRNNIIRKRVA